MKKEGKKKAVVEDARGIGRVRLGRREMAAQPKNMGTTRQLPVIGWKIIVANIGKAGLAKRPSSRRRTGVMK
jgi:hypothetical protein